MKSWFVVPTTQMPIFVLFVSAGVSFDGAFSMWVFFKVKSAAMLTKAVIGHIPREISRFCWYFMDYGFYGFYGS